MASTALKEVRAKTLPEIRREEAADKFHNLLRGIPSKCSAFEFTNELLVRQFDSAIDRILNLRNIEQLFYKDGNSELAAKYHSRSIEVKRRFSELVRGAVELMSDDRVLAQDIVCDAGNIVSELVTELRLMGE